MTKKSVRLHVDEPTSVAQVRSATARVVKILETDARSIVRAMTQNDVSDPTHVATKLKPFDGFFRASRRLLTYHRYKDEIIVNGAGVEHASMTSAFLDFHTAVEDTLGIDDVRVFDKWLRRVSRGDLYLLRFARA